MVLTSDGKVYSWGRGSNGVLGNGTLVDMSTPAPVEVATTGTPMAGKTIVQIALSGTNAYALDSLGAVYSWGCTLGGALGNGQKLIRQCLRLARPDYLLNLLQLRLLVRQWPEKL